MNKKTVKAKPRKLSIPVVEPYEKDFFKWTNDQAKLLKRREFSKLDMKNLIEEIESLGRSEKRTLKSYIEVLLMHMLKVKFQPEKHTRSWDISIENASHKATKTLQENPSLKPKIKEIIDDAYFSARLDAILETGLDENVFPKNCLWKIEEIFPDLESKYFKKDKD